MKPKDGIQKHDLVLEKHGEDSYRIAQWIDGLLKPLEGPYDREQAESRAKFLSHDHGSDAWIEELPTSFRLL